MKLYAVGGAVRDHLRGATSKDLDFAVEAESFDAMYDALRERGLEVYQSRPEFVTVRGRMPLDRLGTFGTLIVRDKYVGENPRRYYVDADFTLCRAETQYSDKRHPDTVTPADLLTDLARRDFTINAIAINEAGEYIDPHSGITDLRDKSLRAVGKAKDRFSEDPLRILRAIRFAVLMDLWIDMDTQEAMNSPFVIDGLATLPVERVVNELQRPLAFNWRETMLHLIITFPRVGELLARQFPEMWVKPTTEVR